MFTIIINEKGGAERRQVFEKPEISIGRLQGNDLMLVKGNVSKAHAKLERRGGAYYVTDQNSTNGTYVNRKRITGETAISEGDRIYIGDYVLRLDGGAGGAAPSPKPSDKPPAMASEKPAPKPAQLDPPSFDDAADQERVFGSLPPLDAQAGNLQGLKLSQPPPPPGPEHFTTPPGASSSAPPARIASKDLGSVLPVARSLVETVNVKFGARAFEAEVAKDLRQQVDLFLQAQIQATGAAKGGEGDRLLRAAKEELFELGPLTTLLSDREVTQIIVNGTSGLSVQTLGQPPRLGTPFSTAASLNAVFTRLCVRAGFDPEMVRRTGECVMSNGFRLKLLDPRSGHLALSLVRVEPVQATFDSLVRRGAVSRDMMTVLRQCVMGRINVLVVGSRRGGVSELLNALADSASQDIWVAIENRDSFLLDQPQALHLNRADFEGSWDALVGFVSGLPEVRLLVEDLSHGLCASVLQAIAGGVQGVVGAASAPSIEVAIERLAVHVAARGVGYDIPAATRALANAFSLVVETVSLEEGRDQVQRISELRSVQGGGVEIIDLFRFSAVAGTAEAVVATGNEPSFANLLRVRGLVLDKQLFRHG